MIRATPKITAVTNPLRAAGTTTPETVRHCVAPSATPASRRSFGINRSISSAVRAIVGIIKILNASEPISPVNSCVTGIIKIERINTIKKIINNQKSIIITNTTGLIKNLIPRQRWEKAIIKLENGNDVDIKELLSHLIELGYKREERVEKQGDFSLRGNILDIYPLNSLHPARIDFFDTEIDSMRYFDLQTQRSTKKITIAIPPTATTPPCWEPDE